MLSTAVGAVVATGALATLPAWLPGRVIALRMWLFTRINGDEGVTLPGGAFDADDFRRVYAHPAADGRSRGAALSDLFWYWLSPGAHLHQEHLEPGPRYEEVARATRRILAAGRDGAEERVTDCLRAVLDGLADRPVTHVRLRDLLMPVWAAFYHEVVFGEPCPAGARELIVASAEDVVGALKCCRLRHMGRRHRLTRYLTGRVRDGAVPHGLPAGLSDGERALYLQGVFFTTAVVQSSDAAAHLLLVLARHPDVQERVRAGGPDLDRLMDETLRLYPLFGIAHRVTSADIAVAGRPTIPAGSVVCFDYPAYHRAGIDHADRFDPDRPAGPRPPIPYGMAANRPCPAARLAPVTLRAVLTGILARYELRSSAAHTRALPNRGPCLLVARDRAPARLGPALAAMRLRDRWEDVWRSVVQLVLGAIMVVHARRLRLCHRHFAAPGPH